MAKYAEKGTSQEAKEIYDLRKSDRKVEGIYQGFKSFDGKRAGEINVIHFFKVGADVYGVWGSKDLNEKLKGEESKQVCVSFKEKATFKDGRTKNIFCVLISQE